MAAIKMSNIFSYLTQITHETIDDHISELYINTTNGSSAPKDLGMHSSKSSSVILTINKDTEYTFEQSISNLNNASSSTGFVLWKISVPFLNWILQCPCYDFSGKFVLELGAGVSGLFASFIGRRSRRYIATDQYHLLKLLKKNIGDSGIEFKSSTIEVEAQKVDKMKKSGKKSSSGFKNLPTIDICCYDWENLEQGQYELKQISPDGGKPDFLIGCDIVYNDYLVPHLIGAIDSLSGSETICLIGLQIRLLENIELFIEGLLEKGFDIYQHDQGILTHELSDGFVVYYIKRSAVLVEN